MSLDYFNVIGLEFILSVLVFIFFSTKKNIDLKLFRAKKNFFCIKYTETQGIENYFHTHVFFLPVRKAHIFSY